MVTDIITIAAPGGERELTGKGHENTFSGDRNDLCHFG